MYCRGERVTATPYLHLGLNPGSDDVGLGSELAPQPLVGLLSGHLLLEHLVSEGNKVLHLQAGEGIIREGRLVVNYTELLCSYFLC